ncbi:hypothetical protein B0J18DRAFT_127698 [Chaetomium sp. MPI-SDFR-AT-0129]|nr:hypothetical protein B0J18DRAFT_127698 [Chaetomium sp. MPI-SDFR-AT-0129]
MTGARKAIWRQKALFLSCLPGAPPLPNASRSDRSHAFLGFHASAPGFVGEGKFYSGVCNRHGLAFASRSSSLVRAWPAGQHPVPRFSAALLSMAPRTSRKDPALDWRGVKTTCGLNDEIFRIADPRALTGKIALCPHASCRLRTVYLPLLSFVL